MINLKIILFVDNLLSKFYISVATYNNSNQQCFLNLETSPFCNSLIAAFFMLYSSIYIGYTYPFIGYINVVPILLT